jgi:hypothetical protein
MGKQINIVQQCCVSGRHEKDCSEVRRRREGERNRACSEVESRVASLQGTQDERQCQVTRSKHSDPGKKWSDS